MSGPEVDAHWDAVVTGLRQTGDALLVAHVSPDADSIGSALAVGLALRSVGVCVEVTFGELPFVLPRVLEFLPALDLLTAPDALEPARVAVAFDLSSPDRLGVAREAFESAQITMALDHHLSHESFADLMIVDPTKPATAILALDLIDRLGVDLTGEMATCLYAGLLTDTGSFRFASTDSDTHLVASRLLATGIAHDDIARRIYDDEPFTGVQLLGTVLSQSVLEPAAAGGAGLVHAEVSRDLRRGYGLRLDAVERVIDVLRTTTEAEVTAVLKQADGGDWRVSLRSKGNCDVSAVARSFGGGGHRYAAGYTAHGDPADTLEALRTALAGD